MLTVAEDGTIRSANRAVLDLFGYEPAELVGQKIEMLVPQRIRGVHPGLRKSFLDGGVNRRMGALSQRSELRAVRKDGREVPVDISLAIVHAGGERLVLAAVRDVTQDLKQRAELTLSHFLSDTALELTRSAYWHIDFTDPDHYYASKRAQQIFGETADERDRLRLADQDPQVPLPRPLLPDEEVAGGRAPRGGQAVLDLHVVQVEEVARRRRLLLVHVQLGHEVIARRHGDLPHAGPHRHQARPDRGIALDHARHLTLGRAARSRRRYRSRANRRPPERGGAPRPQPC